MRPEPLRRERALAPYSALFTPLRYPDWLSGRGVRVAMRMARGHPWPLDLAERCPDPPQLRAYLLAVAAVLPAHDARRLLGAGSRGGIPAQVDGAERTGSKGDGP